MTKLQGAGFFLEILVIETFFLVGDHTRQEKS